MPASLPVDTTSDQDLMADACSAHFSCIIFPSLCVRCICLYWLIGDVSPNKPSIVERHRHVWRSFLAHDNYTPNSTASQVFPHFLSSSDPLYYSIWQLRDQYIAKDFAFQGKYFNFPKDLEVYGGVGICFLVFMLSHEKEAKQRLRHGIEGHSLSFFSESLLILTWSWLAAYCLPDPLPAISIPKFLYERNIMPS